MITEKQHAERQRYLGASDIAALFTDESGKSLDPHKTAIDVWITKVYELEYDHSPGESIKSGVRWEPYILDWAAQEIGLPIVTDAERLRFICTEHPIFASNLDGFIEINVDIPQIVEAKKSRVGGEWGEPGTDEVPYRVLLQTHTQMLCTGWNFAWVAAMIWGDERLYKVWRNERIIEAIVKRGEQWWNDYVVTKTPPPDSEPGDLRLFKRIVREPETVADVPAELIETWDIRRQERLIKDKEEISALADVLKYLGDAEGANLPDGRTFTYYKTKGADIIDVKLLRTKYPNVYSEVARENLYRKPSLKKVK